MNIQRRAASVFREAQSLKRSAFPLLRHPQILHIAPVEFLLIALRREISSPRRWLYHEVWNGAAWICKYSPQHVLLRSDCSMYNLHIEKSPAGALTLHTDVQ